MRTKNKKIKGSKILIASLLILIIASVLVSLFFNLQGIMLIKPRGHTTDNNPVFKWSSFKSYSHYKLLLDDNQEFTSPLIIETTEEEYRMKNLLVGDYYWKVIGYKKDRINRTESSMVSFTIDSVVSVERSNSQIKNVGNVKLLLEFFSGNLLTGFATLDINKASNLSKNITEVIASQK